MSKPTCIEEGCANEVYAKKRCQPHYAKSRYESHFKRESRCKVDGCERPDWVRGYCNTHLQQAYKTGSLKLRHRYAKDAACRWPDCETKPHGRGLCKRHYQRAFTSGNFDTPWDEWNVPSEANCVVCGKQFERVNRNRKFCSHLCGKRSRRKRNPEQYLEEARRSNRRRRARKSNVEAEEFTNADVRMFHGDDCYLCGERINFRLRWPNPKSPSLDHVIPLSRGGTHTLENCAMTHWECNHKKNANLVDRRPEPTLLST